VTTPVVRLLRLWFGLTDPVSRRAYVLSGDRAHGVQGHGGWADALVHAIHGRVLAHVKYLVEMHAGETG
jgi:hypothetical protein